jgi:hypothetical protein
MSDPKRFRRFASLIHETFPDTSMRIADVAGGKGHLQAALRQLGYESVVSFDKRRGYSKRQRQKFYRYQWFDCRKMAGEFDLVVGMHPDSGTDHIIEYGRINRVPFVVCPCCAIPSASTFWGSLSAYKDWLEHLEKLAKAAANEVIIKDLGIAGRSVVLIGR